jgi:hypothetical protein
MLRRVVVSLTGLLLAGCASQPIGLTDLASYTSAADPGIRTSTSSYAPVIGAYTPRTPVSPNGWRGTGVEVAPLTSPAPDVLTQGTDEASEPGKTEQTK